MPKIAIPYFYEVSHVPKRKRNPVNEIFRDTAIANIAEVSESDAPLVLEYKMPHSIRNETTKIHKFGDDFYTQKTKSNATISSEDFSTYDLISKSELIEFFTEKNQPEWERVRSVEGNYQPEMWAKIVVDEKNEAIRYAEDHIFIDGCLFVKTEVPKLNAEIRMSFSGDTTEIRPIDDEDIIRSARSHDMIFSITQYDEALKWCETRRRMSLSGDEREDFGEKLELTIYHPELLPEDEFTSQEVIRIANYVVGNDWSLQEANDEVIDAWQFCRLRLIEAQENPEDPSVIDNLLDACFDLYNIYEAFEKVAREKYGSSYDKESDVHYASLYAAKEVWEDKNISVIGNGLSGQNTLPSM